MRQQSAVGSPQLLNAEHVQPRAKTRSYDQGMCMTAAVRMPTLVLPVLLS
jgi:hypothetical protein